MHPSFLKVIFIHMQKQCKNGLVCPSEVTSMLQLLHIFRADDATPLALLCLFVLDQKGCERIRSYLWGEPYFMN